MLFGLNSPAAPTTPATPLVVDRWGTTPIPQPAPVVQREPTPPLPPGSLLYLGPNAPIGRGPVTSEYSQSLVGLPAQQDPNVPVVSRWPTPGLITRGLALGGFVVRAPVAPFNPSQPFDQSPRAPLGRGPFARAYDQSTVGYPTVEDPNIPVVSRWPYPGIVTTPQKVSVSRWPAAVVQAPATSNGLTALWWPLVLGGVAPAASPFRISPANYQQPGGFAQGTEVDVAAFGVWSAPGASVLQETVATASAAVGVWSSPGASVIPGAVAVAATAAAGVWSAPGASVTPGAVSAPATAAVGVWSSPGAHVTPGGVSVPAVAAVGVWSAPGAHVTPGAVSVSASAAVGVWAAPGAHVTPGPVSASANAAVGVWVAPGAAVLPGPAHALAAAAVGVWSSPGAYVTPGAVSAPATSAVGVWAAPGAHVSPGVVSAPAVAAVGVWTAPGASVVSGPVTAQANAAIGVWTAPGASALLAGSVSAVVASGSWVARGATVVVGPVSTTATAAVGSWFAPGATGSTLTSAQAVAAVGVWTAPGATSIISALTADAIAAVGVWTAPGASVLTGPVSASAIAAVGSWVAPGAFAAPGDPPAGPPDLSGPSGYGWPASRMGTPRWAWSDAPKDSGRRDAEGWIDPQAAPENLPTVRAYSGEAIAPVVRAPQLFPPPPAPLPEEVAAAIDAGWALGLPAESKPEKPVDIKALVAGLLGRKPR